MTKKEQNAGPPESGALFAVTIQGHAARSEIVVGLDGVREAVLRAIQRGPLDPALREINILVASLDDATTWAVHGLGDGRPFWHWWAGLDGCSISVQRITEPMPADVNKTERWQSVLSALTVCGAELRQISSEVGETRRHRRITVLPTGSE